MRDESFLSIIVLILDVDNTFKVLQHDPKFKSEFNGINTRRKNDSSGYTHKKYRYNKFAPTAPPVELIFPFSHWYFCHWERGEGVFIRDCMELSHFFDSQYQKQLFYPQAKHQFQFRKFEK